MSNTIFLLRLCGCRRSRSRRRCCCCCCCSVAWCIVYPISTVRAARLLPWRMTKQLIDLLHVWRGWCILTATTAIIKNKHTCSFECAATGAAARTLALVSVAFNCTFSTIITSEVDDEKPKGTWWIRVLIMIGIHLIFGFSDRKKRKVKSIVSLINDFHWNWWNIRRSISWLFWDDLIGESSPVHLRTLWLSCQLRFFEFPFFFFKSLIFGARRILNRTSFPLETIER